MSSESLYIINLKFGEEIYEISYNSIDDLLQDIGLKSLLEKPGSSVYILKDKSRLTRDVHSWEDLVKQVVNNSSIILRDFIKKG